MNEVTNERGNFLDDKQKKVKQEIMEKLIDGFFVTLHENQEIFMKSQDVLDLTFSILVMFNREILSHFITNMGMRKDIKNIIKNLFDVTQKEVFININLANN